MSRSVADASILLDAITERESDYASSLRTGVEGVRIGIDRGFTREGVDPQVAAGVERAAAALAQAGAVLVDVDLAFLENVCAHWFPLTAVEALRGHAKTYPARADEYGPVFRALLDYGAACPATVRDDAEAARDKVKALLAGIFARVDILACPNMPFVSMPVAIFSPQLVLPPETLAPLMRFSAPFDFSGHPAISVPCGLSGENLPLSLQLVARHHCEAMLLGIAHACETIGGGRFQAPPVSAPRDPLTAGG